MPRQMNHATKPEIFTPKIRPTALWAPMEASMPTGLYEKGRVGRPASACVRLTASCLAWRTASWAVGADGDAVLRHFLPREGGQRRRQIWQDAVAGLQQRHLNVASPNGAIETGAGAEQIGDLAGHFDAAEASAHDDHREQAILKNGIGLHLGALEKPDQMIP